MSRATAAATSTAAMIPIKTQNVAAAWLSDPLSYRS